MGEQKKERHNSMIGISIHPNTNEEEESALAATNQLENHNSWGFTDILERMGYFVFGAVFMAIVYGSQKKSSEEFTYLLEA